jgi:hypothetical protein
VILELGCKHGLLGHVLPDRRTDYSLLPTGLSLHHRKLAHISNLGQGQDLVNVILVRLPLMQSFLCASSPATRRGSNLARFR